MEQRFCYSCMRELSPDADVCPHCGASNAACAAEQPGHALPCGTVLAGHYVIGRVLGQGGFGITYIGRNLTLETRACIKEYYPSGSAVRSGAQNTAVYWGSGERVRDLDSFVKEARKAVKLRDLNSVIRVWDVFYANETVYIVMDYIEGETLKSSLPKTGKLLTERECVALLAPVLTDLEEVHRRGIIHRDISPDNLMLRPDGTLMLLDLGAAKDLSRGSGQSSFLVAKKGFSPMEQYSEESEIGPWTDVYAVCATVFWCVTGGLLPEPMERMMGKTIDLSGLSPKLAAVLEKGLALKPGDRFQTVDELLEKLETAVNGPALKPWVLPLLTCATGLMMICVGILGLSRGWWGEGASVEAAAASPVPAVETAAVPDETAAVPDVAEEGVFRYEVVGSGVTITGCASDAAVLAIPAELAGKPVTGIGSRAFSGCGALTEITLPESIQTIGEWAFYGCNGLTELNVPAGVEEIGGGAFSNCANLRSIRVDEGSADYRSVDGVLFDKGVTELVQFPAGRSGSYTIPDGVTAVRRAAFFACRGLTELTLPDSVTAIGSSAFKACSGLKSVTVPGGVKEIPYHAFYGCTALSSVTIPAGVTVIGESAFENCGSLREVYYTGTRAQWGGIGIESGNSALTGAALQLVGREEDAPAWTLDADGTLTVTGSGEMMSFADADAGEAWRARKDEIRAVTIGDGVTSIGSQAFSGCGKLTRVSIPDSVTGIGSRAFSGCGALTELTLPESIQTIGEWAFYGCNGLTELSVPAGVEEIGGGAFSNCASLRSIRVDGSNPVYRSMDGVLFDKGVTELVQFPAGRSGGYTIPDGVTAVSRAAFFACRGLTELSVPDSVTEIGTSAFKACSGLKSVTVPGGVKEIPYQAFYGCSSLADITIRDGVTAIGKNAFSDCTALTALSLPASVIDIGEDVFDNCPSLTAIHVQAGSYAAQRFKDDARLVID